MSRTNGKSTVPESLQAWLQAGQPLQGHPPVEQWHPEREVTIDLRIDGEGRWYHQGRPVERIALARLFASILRREANGDYCLVTPVERAIVQVEDVPFRVTEAEGLPEEDQGGFKDLWLQTDLGQRVQVDPEHPLRAGVFQGRERWYVAMPRGLSAFLDRPVYYRLAEYAEARDGVWGLCVGGHWFPLAEA